MNERIRELVKRTGFTESDLAHGRDEMLAVFAKLIAAECAGIYDRIENGNRHLGTDDYLEALQRTFFGVDG
jgi:hypothetical protein